MNEEKIIIRNPWDGAMLTLGSEDVNWTKEGASIWGHTFEIGKCLNKEETVYQIEKNWETGASENYTYKQGFIVTPNAYNGTFISVTNYYNQKKCTVIIGDTKYGSDLELMKWKHIYIDPMSDMYNSMCSIFGLTRTIKHSEIEKKIIAERFVMRMEKRKCRMYHRNNTIYVVAPKAKFDKAGAIPIIDKTNKIECMIKVIDNIAQAEYHKPSIWDTNPIRVTRNKGKE